MTFEEITTFYLFSAFPPTDLIRKYHSCSLEQLFWKYSLKFTEKHMIWCPFIVNLQSWPATLLRKRVIAGAFLWTLRNFSEHIFDRTPPGYCLWNERASVKKSKNKLNNLPGSLFCLCMIFNLLYNWRYDCLRNTTPKQDAHSKFSPNDVPTWLFEIIIHFFYKKLVCKKLELRWQTN